MLIRNLIVMLMLAAQPQLLMNWSGQKHQGIKVSVQSSEIVMEPCIKSGLEVRYRFEMRLCKRGKVWIDRCGETRVEARSLQYDPISEMYTVSLDRWNDNADPRVEHYMKLSDAMRSTTIVQNMPLSFMDTRDFLQYGRDRAYVSVKVRSECRGEYSGTMERISHILSFGLIRVSGFDTGWTDFQLDQ